MINESDDVIQGLARVAVEVKGLGQGAFPDEIHQLIVKLLNGKRILEAKAPLHQPALIVEIQESHCKIDSKECRAYATRLQLITNVAPPSKMPGILELSRIGILWDNGLLSIVSKGEAEETIINQVRFLVLDFLKNR